MPVANWMIPNNSQLTLFPSLDSFVGLDEYRNYTDDEHNPPPTPQPPITVHPPPPSPRQCEAPLVGLEYYKKLRADDFFIIENAIMAARFNELCGLGCAFNIPTPVSVRAHLTGALSEWRQKHPMSQGFCMPITNFSTMTDNTNSCIRSRGSAPRCQYGCNVSYQAAVTADRR